MHSHQGIVTTTVTRALRHLGCGLLVLLVWARVATAQWEVTHADPVRFPTPTANDFLRGYVDLPSTTVTVVPRGNQPRPWRLFLRSIDPNLTQYGKPLNHVLWRMQGSSSWNALSMSDALVAAGSVAQTVVVEFRMLLFWNLDYPGYYQALIAWKAMR